MKNKIIKNKGADYFSWIKENNFSISSPRHRGLYAEMIFLKHCKEKKISTSRINPHLDVLDQVPHESFKKIQQNELKKLGKIPFSWLIIERKRPYFAEIKMGTSQLNKKQKESLSLLRKNKVFLFRVFEDGEILIKKII